MIPQPDQDPRCPNCRREFQAGRERCVWCGADLRRVELPELELKCPSCGDALTKQSFASGFIHACPRCAGAWVSPVVLGQIERFFASSALDESRDRSAKADSRPPREDEGIRDAALPGRLYRACPQCGEQMARRRYGHVSDVVADTCLAHGTWFDAAELKGVLKFLESGGVALSRKYQKQQAQAAESHRDLLHFLLSLKRHTP